MMQAMSLQARESTDRITDFGHTEWTTAAENIAAGNGGAAPTFEQWRTSPGHNENMLDLFYVDWYWSRLR